MNQARDDVLARPALALNQDRNIGAGHFVQPLAQRLHRFRSAENNGFRWNLTEGLNQGTDLTCYRGHRVAYRLLLARPDVHPEHQTEETPRRPLQTVVNPYFINHLRKFFTPLPKLKAPWNSGS